MKRKIWNKLSIPTVRTTGYYLRIDPKSGGITFSLDLAKIIDIDNNRINFIQDEERPTDWYIEPTKDEDGLTIRPKKGNKWDKGAIIQSTALSREILNSVGMVGSTKLIVSHEPTDNLYAIITKSATLTTSAAAKTKKTA